MKFVCTHKCFFQDRSIKDRQVVEIAESDVTDLVRSSFRPVEQDERVEASEHRTDDERSSPTEMTMSEMKRRLDAIGVSYGARITKPALTELYLAQHGG